MIKYIAKGDIFGSQCEAFVNPVDLTGVMGAGLAKDFRDEFPKNHYEYRRLAIKGETRLGQLHLHEVENHEEPEWDGLLIINFPTKSSWKWSSKLEYIEMGMKALIELIKQEEIKSVAIPGLGCGLGQLNWGDVKPIIEKYCNELPEVEFEIYEPKVKSWGK